MAHDNEGMVVANNLVCGTAMRIESQSKVVFRANVEKDLMQELSDPAAGDLRQTARALEAIGAGVPLPEVRDDLYGRPRRPRQDVGAYEHG